MLSGLVSLPLSFSRLANPTCAVLALVCIAYGAAAAKAGLSDSLDAVTTIGAVAIVTGAALCVLALAPRFLRWHWLLRSLGHPVPWAYDVRVFAAGLAMSASPGKAGEALKAALLVPVGIPLSRSLGALVADRLADVAGVAALGAATAWLVGHRQPVLEFASIAGIPASLCIATAVRMRRPAEPSTVRVEAPRWRAWARALATPVFAWAEVWTLHRMPALVVAAMLAFGLQGLVFAYYVQQVAPSTSAWVCIAIYSASILIGAASLLPGGLGAMDAAMVLQLKSQGLPWATALGATLAARASALLLPWFIGVAALLTFARPSPTGIRDRGSMVI